MAGPFEPAPCPPRIAPAPLSRRRPNEKRRLAVPLQETDNVSHRRHHQPNLKQWAKDAMKKDNDEVLAGKIAFSPRASCTAAGVPPRARPSGAAPSVALEAAVAKVARKRARPVRGTPERSRVWKTIGRPERGAPNAWVQLIRHRPASMHARRCSGREETP
jgi:hypothetical protein